jgi:hypothetical protein
MDMHRRRRARTGAARAPLPLLIGFVLFVAALGYMLVASLARREAPVFPPSSPARVRAAGWQHAGDTITLDATDGDRWRRASLTLGRPLADHDSAPWELAAQRYRITVAGALADLGAVPFDVASITSATHFIASKPREMENETIAHWYRYSLVTHLLTPNDHVYVLRTAAGALWKLQLLGYYCPGLTPGCVTVRYAPLLPRDPVHRAPSGQDVQLSGRVLAERGHVPGARHPPIVRRVSRRDAPGDAGQEARAVVGVEVVAAHLGDRRAAVHVSAGDRAPVRVRVLRDGKL